MPKSARRKLIGGLLGILLALFMGEALLARFDPLGFAYYRDQAALKTLIVPDPRGYALRPGTYDLAEFSFTILPDGTRAVPDTESAAARTLVCIGDSVTFGYGVDDDRTWVNLLARALPGARMINAGMSGFNSTNVRRTLDQYPNANAFVYLIVNNDADPENHPNLSPARSAPPLSWWALYLLNLPEYVTPRSISAENARRDLPRYFADLRAIQADWRVLLVAFDDDFGRMTVQAGFPIALIERGTDRVSPADGHPGVRGSQEIAAQVLPLVRAQLGM